ncbi:MAG: 50S ribosomal protein L31e [Nanoarchaeota archaeon]|nr:50S ribosomal protein L31e [Nanoarchaeota archaeon]
MERTYIIPLRKEFAKVPVHKRTKKAVKATKEFLMKHMKIDNVKLGRHLNMKLWARGYKNPPHKIEVHVEIIKDKDGDYAYAELVGVEKEVLKFEKVEKKEGIAGKLEALTGKKETKVEDHKIAEEKVKDKVLKEKAPEVEKAKEILSEKHESKENLEKEREQRNVTRDKKEHHSKKE